MAAGRYNGGCGACLNLIQRPPRFGPNFETSVGFNQMLRKSLVGRPRGSGRTSGGVRGGSWGGPGRSWEGLGTTWLHLGRPLGGLGHLLGVPWGLLGGLGCILGASWGDLGASRGSRGASGAVLGSSCARARGLLKPLGRLLGGPWGLGRKRGREKSKSQKKTGKRDSRFSASVGKLDRGARFLTNTRKHA